MNTFIEEYKKAGNIHQQIKEKLSNIHNLAQWSPHQIESFITTQIKESCLTRQINNGIAFPVNISIDNVVAHACSYPREPLGDNHLVKIDFGVHNRGLIIDSALTLSTSPNNVLHTQMMNCNKEALEKAISMAGADTFLSEIGSAIEEVLRSFSCEWLGKIYEGSPIKDLCGHKINMFAIHGGKAVPNVSVPYYREKMLAGEVYAIEPFLSLGNGDIYNKEEDTNLYCINFFKTSQERQKMLYNSNALYDEIYEKYKTLPFLSDWLQDTKGLNSLVRKEVILSYPPIYEKKKVLVSHFEENIFITDKGAVPLSYHPKVSSTQ